MILQKRSKIYFDLNLTDPQDPQKRLLNYLKLRLFKRKLRNICFMKLKFAKVWKKTRND